jgi:pseudouridine-5'-phosphate glycosidase/pseudouridine kinase
LSKVTARIEKTRPSLVVFDLNLSPSTITALLATTSRLSIPTLCDPTSLPKLRRLVPALLAHPRALAHITANAAELDALHTALEDEDGWAFVNSLGLGAEWRGAVDVFCNKVPPAAAQWLRTSGAATKMVSLLPWIGGWWVKAGERGLVHLGLQDSAPDTSAQDGTVTVFQPTALGGFHVLRFYPPPVIGAEEIVSSTGAGDTLAGGIVAGLVGGEAEKVWVGRAIERVGRTLRSTKAVA